MNNINNCNVATKNGNKRKGKPTITARRLHLRSLVWEQLRERLRIHVAINPKGESAKIAKACGIANSQVHRFLCIKCEHDQEPSFTIGVTLALYLAQARMEPIINCNVATK